jgi:hypothetical protein
MSDQEKKAGHHAITLETTSLLFRRPGNHGKILGLTENKFYEKLDYWQAYADRSLLGGTFEHTPFGFGDTWMPEDWNRDAQRKHSVADSHKTGAENLKDIQNFIVNQLDLAKGYHLEKDYKNEWQCLGAVVHALQDSYSNAHVFRDPGNPTDPYSPIQAFNVYYWEDSTHDDKYDKVPVINDDLYRGTDKAAASAGAILLGLYIEHVNDPVDVASQLFTNEVTSLLHGENILVLSDTDDPQYIALHNAHLSDNSQQSHLVEPNMSMPDGTSVYHGADSTQTDNSQQTSSPDPGFTLPGATSSIDQNMTLPGGATSSIDQNLTLPDGATVSHGADGSFTCELPDVPDSNKGMPDTATIPNAADSNQTGNSQQSYTPEPNMSLPDGATVPHGADSTQTDNSQQSYTPEPNMSLPDGATVPHGADSTQTDHSQQSYTPEPNMSLPDAAIVPHGADSNQAGHSQQSYTPEPNMSLPDAAIVPHGADSTQTDHSQQSYTPEPNMSLPDGATVPHEADSNKTNHSQQSHPGDNGSGNSQVNNHQNHPHDDGSQSILP